MNEQANYPPAPGDIQFHPKVLVVGGGAAGILAAEKVLSTGMSVVLVEKSSGLGGITSQLDSLYQNDTSPARWIKEKVDSLKKDKKVAIHTGSTLEEVRGLAGNFLVTLDLSGKKEKTRVAAIIVATGMALNTNITFPAGVDSSQGMFQLDLEKKMKDFASGNQTFAFMVQESNYLIGAANALKNALRLKKANHNVYVFFDEMKISEESMEKMYHQARREGVYFFRGIDNLKVQQQQGKTKITAVDPQLPAKLARESSIEADYLVFSEEFQPAEGTGELARVLGVATGPGGYFQEDNYHLEPVFSFRRGIYFVGSCRMPDFLHNIQEQADAAVNDINLMYTADVKGLMAQKPEIEVIKCVYCITCYRSCPRDAIELLYGIEGSAWNGAPFINPYACQACGCCVSECPNRAIYFPGYSDDEVEKELQKMGGKS